ncbi:unnamed protein product [Arctia plantaginis]|uniref:HAT C-terminal dimerisation domain-containing protein n=1 Tax=Arctia plantaginis TaxID=874455 RepID=A0A8S1B0L9_ARCPL|nr:unnamed protein product [Arctia plantaginis]
MHTKMRDLYRNLIKLVMQPECMLDDKLDKIDPTILVSASANNYRYLKWQIMKMTYVSSEEQQDLDDQWRCLPSYKQNTLDTNEPSDIFWHQVAQLQNKDGKKPFSTLSNFMLQILCLPHSNADCERVFSQIDDIKTDKRNKLVTKTVTGNLLAEQCIKRHGKN